MHPSSRSHSHDNCVQMQLCGECCACRKENILAASSLRSVLLGLMLRYLLFAPECILCWRVEVSETSH